MGRLAHAKNAVPDFMHLATRSIAASIVLLPPVNVVTGQNKGAY